MNSIDAISLAYLLAASADGQKTFEVPAGDRHVAELQSLGLMDANRRPTRIGKGLADKIIEHTRRKLAEICS